MRGLFGILGTMPTFLSVARIGVVPRKKVIAARCLQQKLTLVVLIVARAFLAVELQRLLPFALSIQTTLRAEHQLFPEIPSLELFIIWLWWLSQLAYQFLVHSFLVIHIFRTVQTRLVTHTLRTVPTRLVTHTLRAVPTLVVTHTLRTVPTRLVTHTLRTVPTHLVIHTLRAARKAATGRKERTFPVHLPPIPTAMVLQCVRVDSLFSIVMVMITHVIMLVTKTAETMTMLTRIPEITMMRRIAETTRTTRTMVITVSNHVA